MTPPPPLKLALAAALLALAFAAAPAPASAAPFNCSATAIRGTILTAPAVELLTANKGQAECRSFLASLASLPGGLPAPLNAGSVLAQTVNTGSGSGQKVTSAGGLTNLRVPLVSLPIQLPGLNLPPSLGAVSIPIPALPVTLPLTPTVTRSKPRQLPIDPCAITPTLPTCAGGVTVPVPGGTGGTGGVALPGLPTVPGVPTLPPLPGTSVLGPAGGTLTLDLRPALDALTKQLALPSADLLNIGTLFAQASGYCSGSSPRLVGGSQASGVKALGADLPSGIPINRVLTLINGGAIDPSNIDVTKLDLSSVLPASVLGNASALATVQQAIRGALDGLPNIPLPQLLANVRITPGSQTVQNGTLIQRALGVNISVAGTQLADLLLGEATVGGGNCAGASDAVGPAASALALQCTSRDLVLIDVLPSGNRVRLLGAADRRFIGRQVSIVFTGTHKTVAHATVGQDGIFRATAPLPPRSLRNTNRARYQAKIGSEKSLRLKLMRRMAVTSVRSAAGKVTIRGRVVPPLGSPTRAILLKRRVSCTRSVTVERIRPDRNGRFKVTVNGPSNAQAAVYRLQTQVRKNRSNPKLFPTFTLPRFVEL
jgi:hypothetical protein